MLHGFVNVDARPFDGAIIDDVRTLSSFKPCSVDLIYVSHVLEHVSRHERNKVLERWCEILKPGAILRIAVPDFAKVVHLYQDGVSLDKLIGFLYGGQDYETNFHHYCWDFQSLESDLENAGFRSVAEYEWRNTEHSDVDDYSQSYWPHMEKNKGLLMSLNVEAIKEL
jgi:predicted SAM-dependent methyltransferase